MDVEVVALEAAGDACCPDEGPRPLVALLDRAAVAFIAEFDRRLADSEFCALSLAHSKNVLRYLGAGPTRASQIVERAGVTKQAVSQQIVHLERKGYITVAPDPGDLRARSLALTDKGRRAQAHVTRLFADIEREWADALGAADVASLRDTLTRLLERRSAGPC